MIKMNTVQQEIEQGKQLNRIDDDNGKINLYRELILNNAERIRATDDANGTVVNFE